MSRETTLEKNKLKLAKARASRLKITRKLAGCSTAIDFSRRYGIPLPTIKAWESGTNTPLSTGGAYKVSELLKPDGIIVSPDWLLTGTAPEPCSVKKDIAEVGEPGKRGLEHFRNKLISSWTSYNPKFFFSLTLHSDLHYPAYISGDTLLGYWLTYAQIDMLPRLQDISLLISVENEKAQLVKAVVIQNTIEYSLSGKLQRITTDEMKHHSNFKLGLVMATVNKLFNLPEE